MEGWRGGLSNSGTFCNIGTSVSLSSYVLKYEKKNFFGKPETKPFHCQRHISLISGSSSEATTPCADFFLGGVGAIVNHMNYTIHYSR